MKHKEQWVLDKRLLSFRGWGVRIVPQQTGIPASSHFWHGGYAISTSANQHRDATHDHCRYSACFTLIELFMVIAIIAILAGLLIVEIEQGQDKCSGCFSKFSLAFFISPL